ncbi:hypothetical protein SAMD00023353_1100450 [Rosellinia necatrix]|uniref:Uncharacterized protein n=1 Tax=Rosellinia necatrix TaxID=77044 RepID=A0A1S8A6H5_ROSNE|nr:hypothetical protein SAMD00023353_1100450 [Rosellinia necatrix]
MQGLGKGKGSLGMGAGGREWDGRRERGSPSKMAGVVSFGSGAVFRAVFEQDSENEQKASNASVEMRAGFEKGLWSSDGPAIRAVRHHVH